ncbi:hypothetical protein GUJ93_ZPchr0013g35137 [Zizania palustris]|uniref:Uncharacterized protein n=1 Tax=Zizania palustris TaxID=103762 RepID=A0A8J5WR44_ZIZPA|nr:hypothetical protein GUJ93_ZPchr0013g35137 [Zizania palustris]
MMWAEPTTSSPWPRHACLGCARPLPAPAPDCLPPPRQTCRAWPRRLSRPLASRACCALAAPSTFHVAHGNRRAREARGRGVQGLVGGAREDRRAGAGGEGAVEAVGARAAWSAASTARQRVRG